MGVSRWPLLGMVVAGSLAAGSCAGALAGHFTVTGGLSPGAGWDVPSFGTDREVAALPPAVATARVEPTPQFAGYYPADDPVVSTPAVAETAAREFDALYDAPADAEPEPAPPADTETYSEDAAVAVGAD